MRLFNHPKVCKDCRLDIPSSKTPRSVRKRMERLAFHPVLKDVYRAGCSRGLARAETLFIKSITNNSRTGVNKPPKKCDMFRWETVPRRTLSSLRFLYLDPEAHYQIIKSVSFYLSKMSTVTKEI